MNSRTLLFVVPRLEHWGPSRQLQWLLENRGCAGWRPYVLALEANEGVATWQAQFPESVIDVLPKSRPHDRWGRWRRLRQMLLQIDPALIWNWGCDLDLGKALPRPFRGQFFESQWTLQNSWNDSLWPGPTRLPDCFFTNHIGVTHHRFRQQAMPKCEVLPKVIPAAISDADRESARQQLRKRLAISEDAKVMTTLAPLEPGSSLKDLIWACDQLGCIRSDVHLLVVGRGRQLWRLQRYTRLTEAGPFVHFLDDLDEQAVAGADGYWNTLGECEPDGVLAAMQYGVPVITNLFSADDPLLRHQQTVLGVEPGRRDQFSRWTKYILEQPRAVSQLTNQARARLLAAPRMSDLVERYRRVLPAMAEWREAVG